MATILDVGLLQYFSVVFPVILVFAIVYALLFKTKAIGDNPAINALIAIVAGLLMVLSEKALEILNFMIPWFAIAVIFLIMLIMLFKVFGLKDDSLTAVLKDKAVYWALILVALGIVGAAFANSFGQDIVDAGTGEGDAGANDALSNVIKILTNSKVLGFIVIIAIAVAAVFLLTG